MIVTITEKGNISPELTFESFALNMSKGKLLRDMFLINVGQARS